MEVYFTCSLIPRLVIGNNYGTSCMQKLMQYFGSCKFSSEGREHMTEFSLEQCIAVSILLPNGEANNLLSNTNLRALE